MNPRSINYKAVSSSEYGPIAEFPNCGDERTGLKRIMITDNYLFTEQLRTPRGGYDMPVI